MNFFHALKIRCVTAIWNLTPNCKEMARLASQTLERPPTLKLWLKTRLHFLICAWCARYWKHLRVLRQSAARLQLRAEAASDQKLSPAARDRIKRALVQSSR